MTKRSNKTKSIWESNLFLYLVIPIIAGLIILLVTLLIDRYDRYKYTSSLKDSVFEEILYARNKLGLALLYFNQVELVTTIPTFDLFHKNSLPKLFTNNRDLKKELNHVYTAISVAKKSVEELKIIITDQTQTQIINLRKKDIIRAIKLADKVGPILAKEVNRVWKIPPKELTDQKKKEWYNNVIISSDSSAPLGIQ